MQGEIFGKKNSVYVIEIMKMYARLKNCDLIDPVIN